MKKRCKILLAIVAVPLLIVSVYGVWYGAQKPSNEKNWSDTFWYTSHAQQENGLVHLGPVRDWVYGDGEIIEKTWIQEMIIDPSKITRVWFLLEPFPSWHAVGHTYLTFELEDGTAISFSVEARMEEGESYSVFRGLFRSYELAYTWGTERDFLTRRLFFLNHRVYRYPLAIQQETAIVIFKALAEATNDLAISPAFYNTLTANCTNALAQTVNSHYTNKLPYDVSWNFPGSSDFFLMKHHYITVLKTPEATRAYYDLSRYKEEMSTWTNITHQQFSTNLKELLSRTESQ